MLGRLWGRCPAVEKIWAPFAAPKPRLASITSLLGGRNLAGKLAHLPRVRLHTLLERIEHGIDIGDLESNGFVFRLRLDHLGLAQRGKRVLSDRAGDADVKIRDRRAR